MISFINKIKSVFAPKKKEKTVWIHEEAALEELPNGVRIIDNHGMTEMGPCTIFTKIDKGVWSYTLAYDGSEVIVKSSFLNMPFAVLSE